MEKHVAQDNAIFGHCEEAVNVRLTMGVVTTEEVECQEDGNDKNRQTFLLQLQSLFNFRRFQLLRRAQNFIRDEALKWECDGCRGDEADESSSM